MNIVEKVKSNKYVVVLTTLFTVITAIFGLYTGIISFKHELGGSLNASIKNYSLNNNETRTIVVCFDTPSIDMSHLFITPTFDNPSEYSLKDFSLEYEVICHNINFQPNTLVSAHELGNNKTLYKYNENTLSAYGDTKQPFSSFTITGGNIGRCEINTKATYDGAPNPFYYRTDVWFIHEPNRRNVSFDFWKANCKTVIFKNISTMHYDVHYLAQNAPYEHQFDVALQAKEEHEKTTGTAYSSNRQVTKTQDDITQPVSQSTPAPKETPIVKKEQLVVKGTASNNGDLQIVSYEVTEKNKYNFTSVSFKLNQALSEKEKYLLTYDISIDEEDEKFMSYIEIEIPAQQSTFSYTLGHSKYRGKPHFSNFKLVGQVKAEDYIDIQKTDKGFDIINKSESIIIVAAENSDRYGRNSRTSYCRLNKGKITIEAERLKYVNVYDITVRNNETGASSKIEQENSLWFNISIILAIFGLGFLIMLIGIFFSEDDFRRNPSKVIKDFFKSIVKECSDPKERLWSIPLAIFILGLPVYFIFFAIFATILGKWGFILHTILGWLAD